MSHTEKYQQTFSLFLILAKKIFKFSQTFPKYSALYSKEDKMNFPSEQLNALISLTSGFRIST